MNKLYTLGGHRGMGCTDHTFYQDKRDIAHLPVENTLDSFEMAFANGADYVELDAVMSRDGVIFTLHNVVPGDHFFADKKPNAMLNEMDFASIQSYNTGRYELGRISSLADTLNTLSKIDPNTLPWVVNIELKGVQGSGQAFETNGFLEAVAKTVQGSPVSPSRILFSSFCFENISRMSHLLPTSHYGMLFNEDNNQTAIYSTHQQNVAYQYLPFNANNITLVNELWEKHASPATCLGYLHPEVDTITEETLIVAKENLQSINCWAYLEPMSQKRAEQYAELKYLCDKHSLHLTIITDYLKELTL